MGGRADGAPRGNAGQQGAIDGWACSASAHLDILILTNPLYTLVLTHTTKIYPPSRYTYTNPPYHMSAGVSHRLRCGHCRPPSPCHDAVAGLGHGRSVSVRGEGRGDAVGTGCLSVRRVSSCGGASISGVATADIVIIFEQAL